MSKQAQSQSRRDPVHNADDESVVSIVNAKRGRVYKLPHKRDMERYEDMGYQFVTRNEGERLRGCKVRGDGDTIEYEGHVLMWISEEEHMRIQQEGPRGKTGQQLADKIDAKLIKKDGATQDHLRGLGLGRTVAVENKTTAPEATFD